MMKSFFKKLAFVMALAMVVSLAAPAATTAAAAETNPLKIAYQNGMAITEINLTTAGDFEDLRFLGVSNYKELGGAKWSSSNEAVATVDAGGLVTAVANGTAVVTVTIGDMTANVTVNVGNLPTYNVTIGIPAEGKDAVTEKTLKVGESVDFNFKGIKDYSQDKIGGLPRYLCTWQSDDTTVLTKDNNAGLFTAVKAGTAKVTLTVANILTSQTHNVVPVLVTVEADATPTPTPSLVVNQLNATQNTVKVEFAKSVTELGVNDVEMYRVFKADDDNNGDGKIDAADAVEPYQHFYVYTTAVVDKTDDKIWTITTFDDFTDGATYEIRVKGRTEQFVASVGDVYTVEVKESHQAVLETEDAPLEEAKLYVKLYDIKGVDVTTRKINGVQNNDSANISYELTEYDSAYSLSYDEVAFYEDTKATVVATYSYNGEEVTSAPLTIWPTERAAYGVEEIVAWTLVPNGGHADWTNLEKTVPAGEYGYTIATLIKDTRGNYFTTHEGSATANSGVKYNGKNVYFTEDENKSFWMNGLYVEYKAMNPDKMLVEDYGEIASYEEGKARFALYLYNYNLYNDEFVKELYSQYITVCHPMELKKVYADANVSIMLDTKDEAVKGAYYNLFSQVKIVAKLLDIHTSKTNKEGYVYAKDEHADAAEFAIKLTSNRLSNESDASWDALVELVEETYLNQLLDNTRDANGNTTHDAGEGYYRYINVNAKQFKDIEYRSQVKFRITETTTNTSVNVTINLKKLVETDVNGVKSDVALVKELEDDLKTYVYFQKFGVASTSINVDHYMYNYNNNKYLIDNYLGKNDTKNGYEITLLQYDKNSNAIGYENLANLFLGTTVNAKNIDEVVKADGTALAATTDIASGDRVITVKTPDGKPYALVGANGVANVAFEKKLLGRTWAAEATSDMMGLQVKTSVFAAKASDDTVTNVPAYNLIFSTQNTTTPDRDDEFLYAKTGRYTVTIRTVESVDNDGVIHYATGAGLKTTIYVNVTNSNPTVSYASRDLTRVEGTLPVLEDGRSGMSDDETMRTLILEAFNFNLGDGAWEEARDDDGNLIDHNWKLDADDILYFTYTMTPSNNQIVINSVTFKAPVYIRDAWGNRVDRGGWYRATCTVNKSLTFSE